MRQVRIHLRIHLRKRRICFQRINVSSGFQMTLAWVHPLSAASATRAPSARPRAAWAAGPAPTDTECAANVRKKCFTNLCQSLFFVCLRFYLKPFLFKVEIPIWSEMLLKHNSRPQKYPTKLLSSPSHSRPREIVPFISPLSPDRQKTNSTSFSHGKVRENSSSHGWWWSRS